MESKISKKYFFLYDLKADSTNQLSFNFTGEDSKCLNRILGESEFGHEDTNKNKNEKEYQIMCHEQNILEEMNR